MSRPLMFVRLSQSGRPPFKKMPRINLYRNISIFFIIFTAMILCAIFLFFYSQGAIIITPEEQDIKLNFNAEVSTSTPANGSNTDAIIGTLLSKTVEGSGTFDVLSTKTSNAQSIGSVKIVNNSNKSQALVKSTQLQATDGTIVRTSENVTVPAGSSVVVGVYPKDDATFVKVNAGNLKIIKLATSLQDKIYAVADTALAYGGQEVKMVSQSDINRGKQELAKQLIAQAKSDLGLKENEGTISEIIDVKPDKQVGDISDKLNLTLKIRIKYLKIDSDSLKKLIAKKASESSFAGLTLNDINLENLNYSIIDGSSSLQLIKVNYSLKAFIDASNPILSKDHFAGKTIDEVKQYLADSGMVKKVQISISPYWKKSLPKEAKRIKVIISNE